jgi:hypothetical protein
VILSYNFLPHHFPNLFIFSQSDEAFDRCTSWRLDASRTPFAKARSVLKPYPEELMDAHDVSTIVNSAKYDGPECIQPVLDDEIPRGGQLSLL